MTSSSTDGSVALTMRGSFLARFGLLKQPQRHGLGTAVDDAVHPQPLHRMGFGNLPRTGAADDHLGAMFANRRMKIDAFAFRRVDRPRRAAENVAINAGRKRGADRIVGAHTDRGRVRSDEMVQIIGVTNHHVFRRVVLEKNRFNDPDAIGDHHRGSVGIAGLFELILVQEARYVTGRRGSVYHLLPRAEGLFGAFGVWRGENELHLLRVVRHTLHPSLVNFKL